MGGSCPGTVLLTLLLSVAPGEDEFWLRDEVVLKGKSKPVVGVVIERYHPDHLVVLLESGKRKEYEREKIETVEVHRDRLAKFMALRAPELPIQKEVDLIQVAAGLRLPHMARLQAYRVLTLDPGRAEAHEYLGHKSSSSKGWKWVLGRKKVDQAKFDAEIQAWNSRLVLESEHFAVETDAGLRKALDILFDLEALYLWWMEHLGPIFEATEDVDDPDTEKPTFVVFRDKYGKHFSDKINQERRAFYDPTQRTSTRGGIDNLAYTHFLNDAELAEDLYSLGTQALIYSTLVLGKKKGEPVGAFESHAPCMELGLGYWVTEHCSGEPGYVQIRAPFTEPFELDAQVAQQTVRPMPGGNPLSNARNELTNLITLQNRSFFKPDQTGAYSRSKASSFVAFLLEENALSYKNAKHRGRSEPRGATREGLFQYMRETYGKSRALSSDALDESLGGKVEQFEDLWKAWANGFTGLQGK